jgi:hypothetical protein
MEAIVRVIVLTRDGRDRLADGIRPPVRPDDGSVLVGVQPHLVRDDRRLVVQVLGERDTARVHQAGRGEEPSADLEPPIVRVAARPASDVAFDVGRCRRDDAQQRRRSAGHDAATTGPTRNDRTGSGVFQPV